VVQWGVEKGAAANFRPLPTFQSGDAEVFEVSAEVGADEMAERAELAARLSQSHLLAANNAPPDLAAYDQQFSRLTLTSTLRATAKTN